MKSHMILTMMSENECKRRRVRREEEDAADVKRTRVGNSSRASTSTPAEADREANDQKRNFEEEDCFDSEDFLSQIPSDTLATVMLLRNRFPKAALPTLCPLVIKSHLYSILKDRTAVDRQLEELNRSNKLQIIKLPSDRNDYGLALWEDYSLVVQASKSEKSKGESSVLDWFLNVLVAQIGHCYISDYQMEKELRAFLSSRAESAERDARERAEGGEEDDYDHYLTMLIRNGFLTRRMSVHGGYWFSVPNLGCFVKRLKAGRKRLIGIVKRRKRSEMLQWDLEKIKLPKATTLGMAYHLRDASGSGMFEQIETTCGPLLRLANKKEWM